MFRKLKRNKYIDLFCSIYLLLIISLCICSCTSENSIFDNDNSKLLNFSISVPEWKNNDSTSDLNTRAMPVSGSSFDKASSFNLIADVYDGTKNYSTIIKDEAVSYTNNMWQTTSTHYWPGTANNTVSFYAYYPASISSSITHTAGFAPTLPYTVPNDATNQIDIITATGKNISGNTNASTPLSFNHIFAAVKFAVGTNGLPSGTIKSITINGINNSGTYTFGSGWTLGSTTTSFTVTPSTTITGTAGANITSDAFTMFMIPQTFRNATFTLAYSNGTTFSTTISGTWNAGGLYTYNLSKTIIYNYDYTGASQTFTAPYAGTYKLECWGAGCTCLGAYTSGFLYLKKNTILYIYVGTGSEDYAYTTLTHSIVFNGGGGFTNGCNDFNNDTGGGATDIRLVNGSWDDFLSLKSRIMVAAGGSGSVGSSLPGYGGALVSINADGAYPPETFPSDYCIVNGVSQTNGYSFGIGQSGLRAGGGGGYYGGYAEKCAGSGGSSFISGYSGCDAISESSTSDHIIHTGLPNHYSGFIFTNSQMIAGNASMPKPAGGTEIGHTGNGYARITFVSAN
jgi:hypothetical protein